MDFTNWENERAKLIDDVLKEIRQQKDREKFTSVRGSAQINPQLVKLGQTATFGPFSFDTTFKGDVLPAFGQVLFDTTKVYVVQPYVHTWQILQGQITGFTLGVLALTNPPEGLFKHTITWLVEGRAAQYRGEGQRESWTAGYNHSKAHHLYGKI